MRIIGVYDICRSFERFRCVPTKSETEISSLFGEFTFCLLRWITDFNDFVLNVPLFPELGLFPTTDHLVHELVVTQVSGDF